MMNLNNKTIVIMGGGTAGCISALYFLNKNRQLNLNLKVKLISSKNIAPIGVGEGTTPLFADFIENVCGIDKREFLRETKGSFKFGEKFVNWNFDGEYYYHLFSKNCIGEEKNILLDHNFIQYAINENLEVPQKILQKKLLGCSFDLVEKNKICLSSNSLYAYHFSADLIIPFLLKKCLNFREFSLIESDIENLNCDEKGFIQSLYLDGENISGDFFINCLGFKSSNILPKEYFDIEYWDKYILNNSAFAMQVKNSSSEDIDLYTTITSSKYGWCWKVPQYEKTGYGYVYSDNFIKNDSELYDTILKTYNINEKFILKSKIVKSKPFYNRKQFYKNCLSLGLSSGFIEPLEATSIHMTLIGLNLFFELIENQLEMNEKNMNVFNFIIDKDWRNVLKFIIFHFNTNNPINEYWQHYKNIHREHTFEYYEKYQKNLDEVFTEDNYIQVSLGKKIKDHFYNFSFGKYLKNNIMNYLKENISCDFNYDLLYSHREVLEEINLQKYE